MKIYSISSSHVNLAQYLKPIFLCGCISSIILSGCGGKSSDSENLIEGDAPPPSAESSVEPSAEINEANNTELLEDDGTSDETKDKTAEEEAQLIVTLGASEANRSVEDFSGASRSFADELNVFLPSAMDVDPETLRDNTQANVTLPIYEGVGPSGEPTYFIITETSTLETSGILGTILAPKLRYGALPGAADGAQYVTLNDEGRIIFKGDVDFSPERRLEPGEESAFPPSVAEPGAIGDDEYSSLVVLPSGLVINAQIIANASGMHDRINEINIEERWVNFQLLDGWQGGDRFYYHLVTDASAPGPATIELGTYAPRMANLPTFGQSELDGESVLLGFSPNVNGLTISENGVGGINRQGLGSTIVDADLDPVNVFPFDPNNDTEEGNNYSPMWDAHLNMWTEAAINGPDGDIRRAIRGYEDLSELIQQGYITSFSGSEGIENPSIFGLRASNAIINCPVILQPFEGELEPGITRTPAEEAQAIVALGAKEAHRDVGDFSGADRSFDEDLNVFLPSAIDVDPETLRDNTRANVTLPLYKGVGPSGEDTYFILTETSTKETSDILGTIVAPKLRYGALPSAAAAAQYVDLTWDGRIIFKGDVDFSPERRLEPGEESAFPPSVAEPGSVGDEEYSSLVVLPSGLVVNAQIVANATGVHDRINKINIEERWVNFQLLDGWQGGDRFYYHLVTDASDPVPATIELGTYAPRMANLPVFGQSDLDGETVLLGFSPNINGLTIADDDAIEGDRQGLTSTIVDNDLDPVNIFPFDPIPTEEGNNYSPMWDAHLNMWTEEAINNGERRSIASFEDLNSLIQEGLVTDFSGNTGVENAFLFGLRASNAVINCPVILQPFEGSSTEESSTEETSNTRAPWPDKESRREDRDEEPDVNNNADTNSDAESNNSAVPNDSSNINTATEEESDATEESNESGTDESEETAEEVRVTLAELQRDIFTPSCSECHSGDTAPLGLRLDSIDNIREFAINVAAAEVPNLDIITPNDPDASYLVRKIQGGPDIVGGRMPLNRPPLSNSEIDLIRTWVEQGAQAD